MVYFDIIIGFECDNDEEIKNEIIKNNKNLLNQREDLIKYNKKFRQSLSEKKDLENKIKQLKIENNNMQLQLGDRPNQIGFKIKAIKIRKDNDKNANEPILERNMSDPDLIKNNYNDKLYISHNRENFIPIKEIYKFKKYE